jgi:WhiB family redox-sensing transcriptional regulator
MMLDTGRKTRRSSGAPTAPGEAVTIPAQRSPHPPLGGVDWASQAACRGGDPDALFVQGAAQNQAKVVCRACPVRVRCLADALDNRVEFGVWGGMTERERRALLRRRPNVTSWQRLLEAAVRDALVVRSAEIAAG